MTKTQDEVLLDLLGRVARALEALVRAGGGKLGA